MTQDPDHSRRADDYIDRADEGLGWAPIVLGVAFLGLLAFIILGSLLTPQSDRPTTSQRSELPSTAPTAPSVPTPAPPKSQ
jgi:hypothetical protein